MAIKPVIYLAKDSIKNPRDILKKGRRLSHEVNGTATLYYARSQSHPPDWEEFVQKSFPIGKGVFKNASSSAVLIILVNARYFIIPFGAGTHMIDEDALELNFGFKTALNCIPKELIRQIDTTTPELKSQRVRRQAASDTTPEEFGVNKEKDILRGIVGKLDKDHPLGPSLEGRDSLRISVNVGDLPTLIGFCEQVFQHYQKDDYKKDYPWIDNIGPVRDKKLIVALQTSLARALHKKSFINMQFSPPRFYDANFATSGFVFICGDGERVAKKQRYEFPDMSDWKNSTPKDKKITLDTIDDLRVRLVNDDDLVKDESWPLQRCIAWETELKGQKYILSEGAWYKVASDFFQEVTDYYNERVILKHSIPNPSKPKMIEADFNREWSSSSPGHFLFDLGHHDAKDKHVGKDRNEVCDVYDGNTPCFYHVKPGKTSTTLSHLFRQAAFSSEILLREPSVWTQFKTHLSDYGYTGKVLANGYNQRNHAVIFVLILGKTSKRDIPFFSKVSFRDVSRNTLEQAGFKSGIAFVTSP